MQLRDVQAAVEELRGKEFRDRTRGLAEGGESTVNTGRFGPRRGPGLYVGPEDAARGEPAAPVPLAKLVVVTEGKTVGELPLCQGRLLRRMAVAGRRTALEAATDLLRDHVWGGDRLVGFVQRQLFADRYVEHAASAASAAASAQAPVPPPARRNDTGDAPFLSATGLGLAALSPVLGSLFTGDQAVRDLLWPVLLVAAVFQPVAGVVFVLDGVLIGAGDGRYLARGGLVVLAVFAPLAWAAAGLADSAASGLVLLWVAFGVGFMGSRAAVLLHRAHGDRWMVVGASRRPG